MFDAYNDANISGEAICDIYFANDYKDDCKEMRPDDLEDNVTFTLDAIT